MSSQVGWALLCSVQPYAGVIIKCGGLKSARVPHSSGDGRA